LAISAEGVTLNQHTLLGHKVCVVLDKVVLGIALNRLEDGSELVVDLGFGTAKGKFGDPDRLLEQLVNFDEVSKEGLSVKAVDVDVDKVDCAIATAGIKELLEPLDTFARVTAVGNGWGGDASLS